MARLQNLGSFLNFQDRGLKIWGLSWIFWVGRPGDVVSFLTSQDREAWGPRIFPEFSG